MKTTDNTPLMAQYNDIKSRYSDTVLLFRVGDFYETFYDDAVEVSKILNIALTTRDKNKANPIPLAGVPFHAAETYITRLLAAGKKVAICEQVEDASQAKGLVRRDVVEVLTPGTSMNTGLLEDRENNFCMAVRTEGARAGVALVDVSTGDFLSGEDDLSNVHHLLQGKRIREVVARKTSELVPLNTILETWGSPYVSVAGAAASGEGEPRIMLDAQFAAGAEDLGTLEEQAVAMLLAHCKTLRGGELPQVTSLKKLAHLDFLTLDDETIRNLELFEPLYGADDRATLIRLLDRTMTPMGGREMRGWLQKPLCHVGLVEQRTDAVAEFYGKPSLHENVVTALRRIRDIQRLASRIAARKAIPREFHALRESLDTVPALRAALDGAKTTFLRTLATRLDDHSKLAQTIARAIVDEPPGHLRDGGVIRKGFAAKLDELIEQSDAAKRWITGLERRERERTGIPSLKVGYNKVFGYYVEVSRAHRASVPDDYIAKQTLVNAERFYTRELKDKEQVVLENEERRIKAEQEVYDELCQTVAGELSRLQETASATGQIDVLAALAAVAKQHGFRRAVVDDSTVLDLVASRHPVLEQLGEEPFVPNDLRLDLDRKQVALITGPNMSGKSTFLRQVALVVILAQIGSFVPADRARIGVVDSIFTRVGAGDRLSRGESTFLVEMKETAHILDNMTDRSLVLLDEVGRGTSTYDGLSIAWAVTEYLLEGIKGRPKALFATHFHELTQLRSAYPRLVNLKITIREWERGIIFLRKIVAGTSDRSYGINAARMAGLPPHVLKRAGEILQTLELRRDLLHQGVAPETGEKSQFSLFGAPPTAGPSQGERDRYRDMERSIASFDIDASTPLEALQLLKTLRDRLKDK